MKKVLALILAALFICGLSACGKKKNENVIVVGYTDYAPMNYKDENGKLVGFDTELAQKVFKNLGYKVIFQVIKWENKYTDLESGTINCIWNGFTSNGTDEEDGVLRSKKVDFSYNYMENRQVIVVKDSANINTVDDLKGKFAAAETGSAGETYANTFEDIHLKGFTKQTDCLFEVKAGTVDFAVLDAQLAKSYCGKEDYADIKILDGVSSDVEYYAVGFKKDSELTAKVNEQLEKLAADGTIKKLAEKYGVENTVILDFSDQK